jgi:hypothetical protein
MRKCALPIITSILLLPSFLFAQATDHGDSLDLGSITILGKDYSITRLGELTPGKEGAFEVASNASLSSLSAYLWVESKDGSRISAPSKGIPEKDKLHFHVVPKAGSEPERIVLRVREAGKDERASLPLDGHGHEHAAAPHDGVVAKLMDEGGKEDGYIELKLHDDKGDLELWIAKDKYIESPMDLSLDSMVNVKFIDHDDKVVGLKVRNITKNEDEDGKGNIRAGKTNYFIYPSQDGQDSKWLMGKDFSSIVVVSFSVDGKKYTSEEFALVPHTHEDGHKH